MSRTGTFIGTIRRHSFTLLLVLGLALINGLMESPSHAANSNEATIRSFQDAERGRLLIEWLAPIKVLQKNDDNRLILRFSRPLSVDAGPSLDPLKSYLDVDRTTIDGTDLLLMLKPDVSTKLEIRKQRIVAINFTREEPIAESVRLNVSTLPNGMRLSLDWPRMLGFEAAEEQSNLLVTFQSASRISEKDLNYLNETLQPWFREVRQRQDPAGTSLTFDLRPMIVSSVKDAGQGRVIIDLTRDASAIADRVEAKREPAIKPKLPEVASAQSGRSLPPIPKRRPKTADASATADKNEPVDANTSLPEGPVVDELLFDWQNPVGAAVFKRAGYLWVVFDAPPGASKTSLPPPPPSPLMAGEMMQADEATVIRYRLASDTGFEVRRDETGHWHIRPDSDAVSPSPVSIAPADRPGVLRALSHSGGRRIKTTDPLVGDQLSIWTLQQPGVGQQQRRRFVDLEFLSSLQGLVWRQFNDDIIVRTIFQGIELSSERGLALSSGANVSLDADAPQGPQAVKVPDQEHHDASMENDLPSEREDRPDVQTNRSEGIIGAPEGTEPEPAVAASEPVDIKPSSYLNLAGAGLDRELVAETRRILRQAIAKAAPEERDRARLDLARMLVAEKLAAEAKIVLQGLSEDLEGSIAASRRALHGASAFLTGDLDEAGLLLRASDFDEDDEIGIWRAALDSLDGNWQTAAQGWIAASGNLDVYPSKLRLELGLLALESAIETNDDRMTRKGITRLKALNLKPLDQARVDRLHALKAVRDGDLNKAKEILQIVADGRYPDLSVAAEFELMSLGLSEQSNDSGLLAALHERLPLWRGHPQEADMIDSLARRYRDANEPREALSLWEHLALIRPETADDPIIKDQRHATYVEAINKLAGQQIKLLDAYSIYLDFIDLMPEETDARLVHKNLARHLAGLDLLKEAIVVLQPLLESATNEVERAEIGTEMAALLLFQERPQEALSVLDRAEMRSTAKAEALTTRWQLVRARTLAKLDRDAEALRQIQDLQTSDARHVRAEIFWKQRNWNRLAAVIETVLDDPDLSLPLRKDDQKLILWLALARQQLSQTKKLDDLRRSFAAEMMSGPWYEAFLIATQIENQTNDIISTLAHAESQLLELRRFRESANVNPW